jgi:hypothetical protein
MLVGEVEDASVGDAVSVEGDRGSFGSTCGCSWTGGSTGVGGEQGMVTADQSRSGYWQWNGQHRRMSKQHCMVAEAMMMTARMAVKATYIRKK